MKDTKLTEKDLESIVTKSGFTNAKYVNSNKEEASKDSVFSDSANNRLIMETGNFNKAREEIKIASELNKQKYLQNIKESKIVEDKLEAINKETEESDKLENTLNFIRMYGLKYYSQLKKEFNNIEDSLESDKNTYTSFKEFLKFTELNKGELLNDMDCAEKFNYEIYRELSLLLIKFINDKRV